MKKIFVILLLFMCLISCNFKYSDTTNDVTYNELSIKYEGHIFIFDNHQYIIRDVRKSDNAYFFICISYKDEIWFSEKELNSILKYNSLENN